MINKYRVFCATDNKFEHVICDGTPTKCPVDDTHNISSELTSILEDNISVNDGTPTELSLDNYKKLRLNEIDAKTQELIVTNGFAFDSKNFSMSPEAQANWIGLKTMESLLTFPVEITTSDDEAYSLTQANLNAFCGTALAAKQVHLDSGRALKVQVKNATDEAGVDAVVDNR